MCYSLLKLSRHHQTKREKMTLALTCAGAIVIMRRTHSCDDEPKLLYLDSILQALEFLQLHFGFLIEEL